MEISKQTPEQLHVVERNTMIQILPLAIGLAGLLLTMGMMKEYGFQSWYRTPYWLGGVVATIGFLIWLFIPKSSIARFDKRRNRISIEVKRGLRTIAYQKLPLEEVTAIRLEQASFQKGDKEEARYRISMQLFEEWVPVLPEFKPDLYKHQVTVNSLNGFLNLENKPVG